MTQLESDRKALGANGSLDCEVEAWEVRAQMEPAVFWRLRQRMVLEHFKWDPQVGDVTSLAAFAIVLPGREWRRLAVLAEALAREAEEAEAELVGRSDLLKRLGMPRALRRVLGDDGSPLTPAAARVVRFDFHPTPEGWRISEANSDVPGGYTEAAAFSRLVAAQTEGARVAGSPVEGLVEGFTRLPGVERGLPIGLVAATGFMEDQQITAYLGSEFERQGLTALRGHPRQVSWREGEAYLETGAGFERLGGVIRFYQAEWLPKLGGKSDWRRWVRGGLTPVVNPGSAVVVESKRFPLTWEAISAQLPTWRLLLPESRDPREAPWARDEGWLLKTAFCNTGDTVAMLGQADRKRWRAAAIEARVWPGGWVAQRRFETLAIATPIGPMRPCLGVYSVNGRAAGIYGRLGRGAVIDYAATDVAVLVNEDH